MKTKIQNLFIALAWLALPALVQAQFTFTTINGAITITGYSYARGVSLDVVIPAMMNGYPVTSIGDSAFYGHNITSVTIPNSVTNIGIAAFYNCYSLTSVTIPNSVTSIGEAAFRDCTSLTSINVDASNPVYSSMNGVMFDKAQATLLQFPGGLGGSYTIPNSVTSIVDEAFGYCGLTSVTIPNSVTSIGGGVFFSCTSLTSVTIPNSVTTIGDSAFYVCPSLKSVTIPNSVTSIGSGAFADCGLTSVTIPNSVTSIGVGAFTYCTSLTNITVDTANPAYSSLNGVLFDKVQATLLQFPGGLGGGYTIPNSVTNIVIDAFYYCTNLTSVTIPNSVTTIGDSAFYTCYSLTSVTIPNSVINIGSRAFQECESLTSVIIGNSVTSIGDYAFYYNKLTSVTIPASVTNIGHEAFAFCTELKSAYFLGNAPPDDGTVFTDYSANDPATVFYLAGTTGWGSTFGGRPAVLWNPQAKTFSFTGGHFRFNLTGPTNAVIVVEACTNLFLPVWLAVRTNTLSGLGTAVFSDSQSGGQPMRYYRFRSP